LNSIDDYNVEFIGVYGAAVHPKRIKEYFLGENCLIVKNVNELSNILYKVRNKL